MKQSRTVLAVAGPALAHLTRVLSVTDVLRAGGHAVTFATEGMWLAPLAAQRGYPATQLFGVTRGAHLAQGTLALPDDIVGAALDADLALLRELRPDVVLIDWRPSMRLAAAVAGIPTVALVNAHLTRHYSGPLAAPERHPLTRLFGHRVADALMPRLAPLLFRRWARPYRAWARRHGHPGWPDLRDYLGGDLTLYPDLPLLAPTRPGGGSYIGPLADYPLPYDPLPPLRDPVLYVTLGSTLAVSSAYAEGLRELADGWPGSVVVTSGEQRADWPAAWVQVRYADPRAIVAQGYRVAWLFHGGNGSSYQLLRLWASMPERHLGGVALPFHVEQQWNAARLLKLGAISAVGSLHRPDARIQAAVRKLLDQTSTPPPPALAEQLAQYADVPHRAVQQINAWLS